MVLTRGIVASASPPPLEPLPMLLSCGVDVTGHTDAARGRQRTCPCVLCANAQPRCSPVTSLRAKGLTTTVKVGYGSDKATRHRLPSGFYKFSVSNVAELEVLLMQNRK